MLCTSVIILNSWEIGSGARLRSPTETLRDSVGRTNAAVTPVEVVVLVETAVTTLTMERIDVEAILIMNLMTVAAEATMMNDVAAMVAEACTRGTMTEATE